MEAVADLLWCSLWGPELALALRIWLAGEAGRYPTLVAFQVATAAQSVATYWTIELLGWHSVAYLWLWSISEPLLWILMLGVLFEVAGARESTVRRCCACLAAHVTLAYAVLDLPAGGFLIEVEPFVYPTLLAGAVAAWVSCDRSRNAATILTIFGVRFGFLSLLQLQGFIGQDVVSAARYAVLPILFTALPIYAVVQFSGPNSASGSRARRRSRRRPAAPAKEALQLARQSTARR